MLCNDFSRKIFLMLYYYDWPNFIGWLSLLLGISGNMYIVIVCSPGCEIINFTVYFSFLIQTIFYDQKFRTKVQISQELKEVIR